MAINDGGAGSNDVLSSKEQNLIEKLYLGVAEKSVMASAYDVDSQLRPYNPDDIFQKTGDYSIYEDMINDDQVEVCLKLKKDLILASGWEIQSEDGENEAAKEFLEIALKERFNGCFDDALEEILTAFDFGFSLTEKIFMKDGAAILLKSLKTRHPNTWLIHTDTYGNIEKYEQRGERQNLTIEPKSLIHFINQPRFQNPYGKSDLRAAYNAWFIKRQIIKYFAIFLEKAASPTPVAKYDTAAPASAVDAIHNAIKSLQTKTALTIPKGIDIEFLESSNSGDAYHKAINLFNMFIGRALFVPDLIGLQGSETAGGSYALGKDQINIFMRHIARRREKLEAIVNSHIIHPLVLVNFGDVKGFPKFKLKPVSEENSLDYAKLFLEAVKSKFYKVTDEEINHFRSLIKFPEGEIERPEDLSMASDGSSVAGIGALGDDLEQKTKKGKQAADNGKGQKGNDVVNASKDRDGMINEGRYTKAHQSPYMKKVNFKAIENQMESFSSKTVDKTEPILRKIVDDMFKQIERKRPIETKRADKLSEISLKYLPELKKAIKEQYKQAYNDAYNLGERELNKANFRTPVPDEKFMAFLEGELDGAVQDWGAGLSKKARVRVLEAIRDGKPLSQVFDVFDADDFPDMITNVERFARTKFTEIMNRGRVASFNDSGVVAAYQFSAILDDRVTEICAGLDSKIFENGDQPIPPLHWNALTDDSLVTTKNGDVKISEIKTGDLVLTHKGNWNRVYDIMSRFEDKDFYEIELTNGKTLRATGEHPVLTNRGWIRADEITESDHIICLEKVNNEFIIR